MEQDFVTFYSPGTFVAETTTKEVDSWDVASAVLMAASITERYNAKPYAFRFSTRSRGENDLDSRTVATSPTYFIGGKVETLEEVRSRADPDERILLSNMEGNDWNRIWTSTQGWKWTQPLGPLDVVIAP